MLLIHVLVSNVYICYTVVSTRVNLPPIVCTVLNIDTG